MDDTTGQSVAAVFAALVLALGALGALAAVTAERSVDTLLNPSRAEPAEAWQLRPPPSITPWRMATAPPRSEPGARRTPPRSAAAAGRR